MSKKRSRKHRRAFEEGVSFHFSVQSRKYSEETTFGFGIKGPEELLDEVRSKFPGVFPEDSEVILAQCCRSTCTHIRRSIYGALDEEISSDCDFPDLDEFQGAWIPTRDEIDPIFAKIIKYSGPKVDSLNDILWACVSKQMLVKIIYAPYFDQLISGALISIKPDRKDLHICEVIDVQTMHSVYQIEEGIWTNKMLRLKFGQRTCVYPMSLINNKPWTEEMFQEYRLREGKLKTLLTKEYCRLKGERLVHAGNHVFSNRENDKIADHLAVLNKLPERQPDKIIPATGVRRLNCHFCLQPGTSKDNCPYTSHNC